MIEGDPKLWPNEILDSVVAGILIQHAVENGDAELAERKEEIMAEFDRRLKQDAAPFN